MVGVVSVFFLSASHLQPHVQPASQLGPCCLLTDHLAGTDTKALLERTISVFPPSLNQSLPTRSHTSGTEREKAKRDKD